MENPSERKRIVITDDHPRLLTDEDVRIEISAGGQRISFDRNTDAFVWPDDISTEWLQVPSDRGSKYRTFVEYNPEHDEQDLHIVRHRIDKLISPKNFLESDARLSTKGLVLSAFAASLTVALATGAATAVLFTNRHSGSGK